MRGVWFAVFFLVAIVLFNFYYVNYLERTSVELCGILEEIEQSIEKDEREAALKLASKFERNWRGAEIFYGSFLKHSELRDVESSRERALACLERGDYEEFRIEAENLRFLIMHIYENERPLLKNIF